MIILTGIITLIFEILFYSLFMKFTRREGKLWRYILLFILNTIMIIFLGNQNVVTYLLFILLTFIGFKYIVKTKTGIYDILPVVAMLALNLIIELPIYLLCYKLIGFNHFITTMLFELVKILTLFLLKYKLYKGYAKYKKIWDNNDFNIRYFFTVAIYLYIIITIVLLIKLAWR